MLFVDKYRKGVYTEYTSVGYKCTGVDKMSEEKSCKHCAKTKERSEQEKKVLVNRLNRVEGQIRGIRGMVERDAYCADVLTQVAAASAALNSFARMLLEEHIRTCVTEDIRRGGDETVDELLDLLKKLMR